MNDFTPNQAKVIETWVEKRDALLREIGVHETRLNDLKKTAIEAGQALSDLHTQIAESQGRLSEITALEERWRTSLNTDIAKLEIQKSKLESDIVLKNTQLQGIEEKNQLILSEIDTLISVQQRMGEQSTVVNTVFGNLMDKGRIYLSESETSITQIRNIIIDIIEKGNKNIEQTGIVLEKLPKYIFELQRPIPVRRTYSVPRKTFISPDTSSDNNDMREPEI